MSDCGPVSAVGEPSCLCVDNGISLPVISPCATIVASFVCAPVTCNVPVIVVLPSIFTISFIALISTVPSLLILIVVPDACYILILFAPSVLSYSII